VERAKPTQHQAIRLLAQMSLAQYAAMSATMTEATSAAPSGDEARDAVGTASALVIAEMLPSQRAFVEQKSQGLQSTASEQGKRFAQRVMAEASTDGFVVPWRGAAPQAAYAWRSLATPAAAPAYPAIGNMRTFLIESGGALRVAPPPAAGSARFQADLAEVRRHSESPTRETTRIAKFYDMTTGTLVAGFWNERAGALIRANDVGERQAAAILVTMNAAMMDAVIACHDAKYAYWVPRPSQVDPSIKPLIGVPNHPSYPSNHSCISTAAALVLAHFFPQSRPEMERIATEAGLSRIYAGIHFRFDIDAGDEIGGKVAAAAISRHPRLLAKWSRGESLAQQ
jgi:membrane-associated phospholipid phosphatase